MDTTTFLFNKVPGYAELCDDERKAIQEFSLLWSAFEGSVLEKRAEVGRLLAIAEELEAAGLLDDMNPFEEPLKFWSDRYFPRKQESQDWQSLHMNRTSKKNYQLAVAVLTGTERLPARVLQVLLLIVHRLRNNLFHGEKWAYGIAGQRSNFEHACAVMMTTMDLHEGLP